MRTLAIDPAMVLFVPRILFFFGAADNAADFGRGGKFYGPVGRRTDVMD